MYSFYENFSVTNESKMPYSLQEENIHPYVSSPSGRAENNKFLLLRDSARLLFKTPCLRNLTFSCKLGYVPPACAYEKQRISWGIYFGYDQQMRIGRILSVSYFEEEASLCFDLYSMRGKKETIESSFWVPGIRLEGNRMYDFAFAIEEGRCRGKFDDIEFVFECAAAKGKIGFMSRSSIMGLLFSDVKIESSDVEAQEFSNRKFVIPHYDGGSEDYCIEIKLKKYADGPFEIAYSLVGGAFSRKTKDYQMNIWSVQYDIIKNAYIKFYGDHQTERLYLKNGELCFVEQSPDGKDTELVMNGAVQPFKGKFYLEEFDEDADFAFGYEMFRRLGNELQEDEREFLYRDGELIYSGKSLSEDYIITIETPENKKITEMIPKEIDEYEKALFHAKKNHYFRHDEEITFHLNWHMRRNIEMISFKVFLLDAFYDEVDQMEICTEPAVRFQEYGFTSFVSHISLGKMQQGIYHIKAVMLMGEKVVCKHVSAFEVIDDSDISPRESSKIPFIYSGEAAPPNIKYNCPDPWIIKPDHNEIHYVECLLAVPEMTEQRKGWELLKLYKRKMFLWLNRRTMPLGKKYSDYPESMKMADYTNISAPEAPINYIITPDIFKKNAIRKIYDEFREEKKEYNLSELPHDGGMTEEQFKKFYYLCGSEWVDYCCEKNAERLIEFHSEIKKVNPHIKFTQYGPYAIYGSNHAGIHSAKWRMVPTDLAHEMVDGFWFFEDYPFITGQATHYCAWGMMGLLMHMPKARIVVELFGSFDPVCPDGFVCYAYPPMGGVYVESYRTVTQVNEHMYAAVFRDGKFSYYDNPGFQFLQSYNTEAKKRFEAFLKGWGNYLKNKPKMPMKSPAFVMEYSNDDDRYEFDFAETDVNNISQAGQAYVYGIMAQAGLPKGYCTDFEGLMQLNENMSDVCVLPSLKHAPHAVKEKIRELSAKGIGLVAVSDIGDLNDIFGVEKCECKAKICTLKREREREFITCREAEFFYRESGAEVLLNAETVDGERYPVILKYGKNIIINSYICQVGCEDFAFEPFGLANVSRLLKKTVEDVMKEISFPLATAEENCGINLFITENGEKRILLTDYSLCGCDEEKQIVVKLNFEVDEVRFVGHKDDEVMPNLIKKNGKIKGFSVNVRPGESMIFALE